MSPQSGVKLDTPVTYRVYLCHRLPSSKKPTTTTTTTTTARSSNRHHHHLSHPQSAGAVCACRTARTIQVPRAQQALVLRQALAQAASVLVSRHHALPPGSFSVVIDRALVLTPRGRRHPCRGDQDLPGVDIRGAGTAWWWGPGGGKGGNGNNGSDGAGGKGGGGGVEEAVRFWEGGRGRSWPGNDGAAVPVWVEFVVRTPPAERGHAFQVTPSASRGTEVAVLQALANEEAYLRLKSGGGSQGASPAALGTVGGSTTSGSSDASTVDEAEGDEDEDEETTGSRVSR